MAQTLANDGSSNLNSTGSGIKLRANSSGVPMSHDDVDTNFENLRLKVNEVIGEVGTNTTKLSGIASNANNYSLPLATHTVRGGIELFSNTDQSVAANSVSTTASRTYGIQLNSANQAVVNVPWSNTTYSAASSSSLGLSKLGSNTQQNTGANSVTSTASRTYAVQHNSADQLVVNVPWSNSNTTYSTATSSTAGLVKIGYSENGKKYPVELASGKMFVEVPWVNTDTNTTYTAGTGISISGTTISATGGGVSTSINVHNETPQITVFYINASTGTTNYATERGITAVDNSASFFNGENQTVQGKFANFGTVEKYIYTHFSARQMFAYIVFETDVTETLDDLGVETWIRPHVYKVEIVGTGLRPDNANHTKWNVTLAASRGIGIMQQKGDLTLSNIMFQVTKASGNTAGSLLGVDGGTLQCSGYIGVDLLGTTRFGAGIFNVVNNSKFNMAIGEANRKVGWDFRIGSGGDVNPQPILRPSTNGAVHLFGNYAGYNSGLGNLSGGAVGSGFNGDPDYPRIVYSGNFQLAKFYRDSTVHINTGSWMGTYWNNADSSTTTGNNFGPFVKHTSHTLPTDYANGTKKTPGVRFQQSGCTLGLSSQSDLARSAFQERYTTCPGHTIQNTEGVNILGLEASFNATAGADQTNYEQWVANHVELVQIDGRLMDNIPGLTDTTDSNGNYKTGPTNGGTQTFRGWASLEQSLYQPTRAFYKLT
jgi:hypothetical protein